MACNGLNEEYFKYLWEKLIKYFNYSIILMNIIIIINIIILEPTVLKKWCSLLRSMFQSSFYYISLIYECFLCYDIMFVLNINNLKFNANVSAGCVTAIFERTVVLLWFQVWYQTHHIWEKSIWTLINQDIQHWSFCLFYWKIHIVN